MTTEQLLKMLPWEVNTAPPKKGEGPSLIARPSSAFWDEWHRDADSIRCLGVKPSKPSGSFILVWYHDGSLKPLGAAPEKAAAVRWSSEQQAIFAWFREGKGNLLVRARAGTGKTASLKEAFRHAPEQSILYAVFNKKNQVEADAKIRDIRVSVRTLHSLGFAYIRARWEDAKMDNDVEFHRVRAIIGPIASSDAANCVKTLVGLAKNRYAAPTDAQLADLAEEKDCVPEDPTFGIADVIAATQRVLELSKKKDELNRVSFDDMVWLPVAAGWVRPWFDLAAIDEAQDMNALQLAMAKGAVKPGGRVVVVGDDRQCVVSGTQIATPEGDRPVDTIVSGDSVLAGAGRSLLRAKVVSETLPRRVENADVVTIETESGEKLTVTPEHILFAGFDSCKTPALWVVYLMYREDRGFRVGISRTRNSSYSSGPLFRSRLNQERGDAMWILHTTRSEAEARFLEQKFSVVYGLPTWIFFARGRGLSLCFGDAEITRLFSEIDTRSGAERLLRDLGMSFEHPHVTPKCSQPNRSQHRPRRRRNFSVTLCADPRSPKYVLHTSAVSVASREDCAQLAKCGVQTRSDHKGGYRAGHSSADLASIYEWLDRVQRCFPVNIIETARLTDGRALPFCPAGHVRVGMVVFVARGGRVEKSLVTRVTRGTYSGMVFDLNVADVHNYAANGILVHNCVYGFRGAVIGGMEMMKRELNAIELTLTETFRCPRNVVALAREIVPDYRAHESNALGIVDSARAADLVGLVGPGNAILSRTNAPLAVLCMNLLRQGKAAKIEGKDVGQMLINTVKRLKARSVPHFIERLQAWAERRIARIPADESKRAARISEVEDTVATLVSVADGAKNVSDITARIANMFEDEAGKTRCVILSSVHKAKGLEWPHVYTLEWTFKMEDPTEDTEEANIRYVAITRAKEHLTLVRDDGTVK